MRLNAPKNIVFIIAVVLALLAIISVYAVAIPVVSGNAFVVMVVAFVLLAAGNLLKGL